MFSVQCPACGAPIPVTLADTQLGCTRCDRRSPMPEPVAQRLAEARRWLQGLDHRAIQLSAAQRRSLTASGLWIFLHLGFSAVLAAPLVLTALLALVVTFVWGGRVSPVVLGVSFAPLSAAALLSALGLGTLRARRRRLQLACSAQPPVIPGDPARCHVCGAALRAGDGIVRCGHCEADNLVDPRLLARLHRARTSGLDELEQRLQREVDGIRTASATVTAGTVLAAAVAPLLAVIFAILAGAFLRLAELPPDNALRYALRDGCVVEGDTLRAADLMGRRITVRYLFDTPRIERVYLDPVMDEHYVRAANVLGTRRRPLMGACLASPAHGRILAKPSAPRQVQIVGDEVYFLAGNEVRSVWRVSIEGGDPVELPADPRALDMSVYAGQVYTGSYGEEVEAGEAGVFRAGREGVDGPTGRLAEVEGSAVGLTLVGEHLLWFDRDGYDKDGTWGTADLEVVPVAGGPVRTLAARILIPDSPSIVLAGDRVLWVARDYAILAVPLAGGDIEEVEPAGSPIRTLRVTGDTLWWASGGPVHTRALASGPVGWVDPSSSGDVGLDVSDAWLVAASRTGIVAVERSAITTRPAR